MKNILVCFFILISMEATGQTDIKQMVLPNKRVIKITGHPDYPPVIWVNKSTNQFQGIAVELLGKILKEANITPEFINVETWGRAQEEVKNGRIDILLPPYKTEERLGLYNYAADAFMLDSTVVFVKKGKEFSFDNYQDLLKYPGAAIINDSFGTEFDKEEKVHRTLTRLATTEQCFRFVDKDRARFVIAGINSGKAAMAKLNLQDKFTYLPKRIIVTGLYAPVSLKSPWNIPEFNNYLRRKFSEYGSTDVIKQLEKKYLAILKAEHALAKKELK